MRVLCTVRNIFFRKEFGRTCIPVISALSGKNWLASRISSSPTVNCFCCTFQSSSNSGCKLMWQVCGVFCGLCRLRRMKNDTGDNPSIPTNSTLGAEFRFVDVVIEGFLSWPTAFALLSLSLAHLDHKDLRLICCASIHAEFLCWIT